MDIRRSIIAMLDNRVERELYEVQLNISYKVADDKLSSIF